MKRNLAYVYYGDIKGGSTAVAARIDALLPYVAEGFSLSLISTKPSKSTLADTEWYKHNYVAGKRLSWLPGIGPALDHFIGLISSTLWFFKARKSYDLIVFYQPRLTHSLHLLKLASWFKLKSVVEVTELESSSPGFRGRIGRLEEAVYQSTADAFIGISKRLLDRINVHNKPSFVAPIVAREDLRPKKFHDTLTLLYVGSFAPKDDPMFLIKGLEAMLYRIPEISLILVGYGPEYQKCRAYVNAQGLQVKVTLPGPIPHEKIPELFRMADTLLLNRTNSAYANWGYPTKLADYMRSGIPIVCSRIEALESLPDDVAFFYEPGNVKGFAKAVRDRYFTEEWKETVQNAGKYAKTHFNARNTGMELKNYLTELCAS